MENKTNKTNYNDYMTSHFVKAIKPYTEIIIVNN